MLECFNRGEATEEAKLAAARGQLAVRAQEQLALLALLSADPDLALRAEAEETLARIPSQALRGVLARADVPEALRAFFAARGIVPSATPALDIDAPLLQEEGGSPEVVAEEIGSEPAADRRSLVQQLTSMSFTERLKAAVKGSREMRALLIRDPNKLISSSVLSSPKVTDSEVEAFARMANVSDDVLRIIASNRTWTKNYGVVVGLTKNPKTPLSLNMMARLNDRDLQALSVDRNVPEPLRVAARRRIVASVSSR